VGPVRKNQYLCALEKVLSQTSLLVYLALKVLGLIVRKSIRREYERNGDSFAQKKVARTIKETLKNGEHGEEIEETRLCRATREAYSRAEALLNSSLENQGGMRLGEWNKKTLT